jgi:hypothetical protein
MNNVMGVSIVHIHLYPSTCPNSKDCNVNVCWYYGAVVVARTKIFILAFSGFELGACPR